MIFLPHRFGYNDVFTGHTGYDFGVDISELFIVDIERYLHTWLQWFTFLQEVRAEFIIILFVSLGFLPRLLGFGLLHFLLGR